MHFLFKISFSSGTIKCQLIIRSIFFQLMLIISFGKTNLFLIDFRLVSYSVERFNIYSEQIHFSEIRQVQVCLAFTFISIIFFSLTLFRVYVYFSRMFFMYKHIRIVYFLSRSAMTKNEKHYYKEESHWKLPKNQFHFFYSWPFSISRVYWKWEENVFH